MFWLSHHGPESLHRTWAAGRLRLCARCTGTYPMLGLVFVLQLLGHAPLRWKGDGIVAVGLLTPALVDWAVGQFRPHSGTNLWRGLTGLLLGVALGRTLYVHVHEPFPLWLQVQAALVLLVAAPVMMLRSRGRANYK